MNRKVNINAEAPISIGGEAHSHLIPMGYIAQKYNEQSRQLNNGKETKIVKRISENNNVTKFLL